MNSRGEPPPFARRHLQHGADAHSREEHAVRRQADDPDDPVIAIQEDGVDREPHPECMHRPGAFQQESLVRLEFRPAEESPCALPQRLRDPHDQRTEAHLSHDGSVAATADVTKRLVASLALLSVFRATAVQPTPKMWEPRTPRS